jgi:hypothetical protein
MKTMLAVNSLKLSEGEGMIHTSQAGERTKTTNTPYRPDINYKRMAGATQNHYV